MTRFWIFTTTLLLAMLLLFFVVQAFNLPFLAEDTSFLLKQNRWVAALAGIGLLWVDIIAPVPSSIIMLANGMLFGVGLGTLLSLIGGLGAAGLGFWLGRQGEHWGKRWFGDVAFARAQAFFEQHGMLAVIASRPVPILAEAITIIAGMSRMPGRKFLPALLIGLLPTALIYAVAGAYALEFRSGLYVFLSALLAAGLVWIIGRRTMRNQPAENPTPSRPKNF